MIKKYRYDGDRKFKLSKVETDETSLEPDRKKAEAKMQKNFEEIQELQRKLYAEKKEGVIFLFQAMDAAGKDGTISAVSARSCHACRRTGCTRRPSRPPRRKRWHTTICGAWSMRCP